MAVTLETSDSWSIDSYPAVLDDGNTKAWYSVSETYLTLDTGDSPPTVDQLNDRSGNGLHLTRISSDEEPTYANGAITFDGITQTLSNTDISIGTAFTFYAVVRIDTWVASDLMFYFGAEVT